MCDHTIGCKHLWNIRNSIPCRPQRNIVHFDIQTPSLHLRVYMQQVTVLKSNCVVNYSGCLTVYF